LRAAPRTGAEAPDLHNFLSHNRPPDATHIATMEGPMVYISAYYRIRFGRVEYVRAHFRAQ